MQPLNRILFTFLYLQDTFWGKRQVKDQFIGLATFKQTHTHTLTCICKEAAGRELELCLPYRQWAVLEKGEALRVGTVRWARMEPSWTHLNYLNLLQYGFLVSIFLKPPTRIYNHFLSPHASDLKSYF